MTGRSLNFKPRGPGLILAVVLGNLAPIAGVIWLGWSAPQVLFLYWLETLIVGLFTAARLLSIGRVQRQGREALAITGFFVLHFGLFCTIHGVFVGGMTDGYPLRALGRLSPDREPLLWALAALAAVQLIDWLRWLMRGEAGREALTEAMFRPYGRVVVMHLTIIVGGFLLLSSGAPGALVILLCVIKIAYEIAPPRFRPVPKTES